MPRATRDKIKLGAKHQITLPRSALKRLGVGTGDYFEVRVSDSKIELIPMALIPRDQAWFWTPDWQAKEKEADRARAAGRHTEHDDVESVISDLKS